MLLLNIGIDRHSFPLLGFKYGFDHYVFSSNMSLIIKIIWISFEKIGSISITNRRVGEKSSFCNKMILSYSSSPAWLCKKRTWSDNNKCLNIPVDHNTFNHNHFTWITSLLHDILKNCCHLFLCFVPRIWFIRLIQKVYIQLYNFVIVAKFLFILKEVKNDKYGSFH